MEPRRTNQHSRHSKTRPTKAAIDSLAKSFQHTNFFSLPQDWFFCHCVPSASPAGGFVFHSITHLEPTHFLYFFCWHKCRSTINQFIDLSYDLPLGDRSTPGVHACCQDVTFHSLERIINHECSKVRRNNSNQNLGLGKVITMQIFIFLSKNSTAFFTPTFSLFLDYASCPVFPLFFQYFSPPMVGIVKTGDEKETISASHIDLSIYSVPP